MIIGLHGVAKSGKDTAYSYIEEYFAETPTKVYHKSFALKLKQSALAALGLPHTDPIITIQVCDQFKEVGMVTCSLGDGEFFEITGRKFLQNYGTEAHRDVFDQDFWVDACLSPTTDHRNKIIVVTDVRFPNEAERIRELDGYVWRVNRPEVETGDTHASEQPLPEHLIDDVIDNDEGLDEYRLKVRRQLTTTINARIGRRTDYTEPAVL